MAFVTAETNAIPIAGFPKPLVLVTGTYTNSAGGTGGIVSPGYTNASGTLTAISPATASAGARVILSDWYTPTTNDATAPGSAVAYNSTRDKFEATMVTTADSTGRYFMLCEDSGA